MTAFIVRFTPRARREILRASIWWKESSGRPTLIAEDLSEALSVLRDFPESGAPTPLRSSAT
jgi:hypothetical protein